MSHITVAYKIWNKETGKFSIGGTWPSFSTSGKSWPDTRTLNNHLSGIDKTWRFGKVVYDNCYIIELRNDGKIIEPISVKEWNEKRGK